MSNTNENGLTFEAWLIRLNTAVNQETGYSICVSDLGDTNTRDAWNDGVHPSDHAVEALEQEGWYDYVDAEPEPVRTALYIEPRAWYREVITLESGERLEITRHASANGRIRSVRPIGNDIPKG